MLLAACHLPLPAYYEAYVIPTLDHSLTVDLSLPLPPCPCAWPTYFLLLAAYLSRYGPSLGRRMPMRTVFSPTKRLPTSLDRQLTQPSSLSSPHPADFNSLPLTPSPFHRIILSPHRPFTHRLLIVNLIPNLNLITLLTTSSSHRPIHLLTPLLFSTSPHRISLTVSLPYFTPPHCRALSCSCSVPTLLLLLCFSRPRSCLCEAPRTPNAC